MLPLDRKISTSVILSVLRAMGMFPASNGVFIEKAKEEIDKVEQQMGVTREVPGGARRLNSLGTSFGHQL